MAQHENPEAATKVTYGDLRLARTHYGPLERVIVRVQGRADGCGRCRLLVRDASLRPYQELELGLIDNRAEASFETAGSLGVHWIFVYFGDEEEHSRYTNFVVEAETGIDTGNASYDGLYPLTRDALQRGRRDFYGDQGRFVGYISGDTWQINGVWLRDWIYQLPAYACWERQMTCGLERFLEAQNPDGSVPDGIRRDGTTWRAAVESDVEYILVLGVYRTWLTTGDDAWMAKALPRLEEALAYVQQDPLRWDGEHELVKRGHTCDTWDFEIHQSADFVGKRFVVATCDQSGYYAAFQAMAAMWRQAGDSGRADHYCKRAEAYGDRANALLWDGTKYVHHVHLTPIDHLDFDESEQLAMGNTWAMTRGLADGEQARAIVDEYLTRYAETGDAHPWWSLQPGYPDRLGYYEQPFLRQGGYANGGLMPWVGGELCRACFQHGREAEGLMLLRGYFEHLRRTDGEVHVWYWPDGEAGFRTTNEVPYTGWGMAQWWQALLEGLAGVRALTPAMDVVEVAPRWAATDERQARVTWHHPSSAAYLAYRWGRDDREGIITLEFAGSGSEARFHLLCPEGWTPQVVQGPGGPCEWAQVSVGRSAYVDWQMEIDGVGWARVTFEAKKPEQGG